MADPLSRHLTNMGDAKKGFERRGLFGLVIILGVVFLVVFEIFWRLRIERGPEVVSTVEWLRNNDAIKREVGNVISADLMRSRSSFSWTHGRPISGRFHFLLKGTRGELDVLVTWRVEPSTHLLIVNKVQSLYDTQNEAIWKNPDQ